MNILFVKIKKAERICSEDHLDKKKARIRKTKSLPQFEINHYHFAPLWDKNICHNSIDRENDMVHLFYCYDLIWKHNNFACVYFIIILYHNGIRVRPDILISIYGRFLGSDPHFQNPEKISEGEELRVRLKHGSAYRYRVMVNSPGVLYGHNASLVLQARQRNSQYC